MGKVIIFYKYVDIEYPHQILKWQQKVCAELKLKGRIILAHEGINATVGGETQDINSYMQLMNEHSLFGNIDFKECEGNADYFPRLRIVVKDEIVRLGVSPTKVSARQAGKHLTPAQAHELFNNNPENLIILDARNRYESKIGTFNNAITPDIAHFRDLPTYLDNNAEQFKDKQVVMFCTAGIRCERASAYLKEKNVAQEVYQIEGGIQRYIEQFPEGHFRGKNYVFDGRISVRVNNDILASCELCLKPCDDYINCMNATCNKHFISCAPCEQQFNSTCSIACKKLVEDGKTHARPAFKKIIDNSCVVK